MASRRFIATIWLLRSPMWTRSGVTTLHTRHICMGGSWVRIVRTVKSALASLPTGGKPDDETLSALLVETESIVTWRSLTYLPIYSKEQEAHSQNCSAPNGQGLQVCPVWRYSGSGGGPDSESSACSHDKTGVYESYTAGTCRATRSPEGFFHCCPNWRQSPTLDWVSVENCCFPSKNFLKLSVQVHL